MAFSSPIAVLLGCLSMLETSTCSALQAHHAANEKFILGVNQQAEIRLPLG
jgi:hypothetical protein